MTAYRHRAAHPDCGLKNQLRIWNWNSSSVVAWLVWASRAMSCCTSPNDDSGIRMGSELWHPPPTQQPSALQSHLMMEPWWPGWYRWLNKIQSSNPILESAHTQEARGGLHNTHSRQGRRMKWLEWIYQCGIICLEHFFVTGLYLYFSTDVYQNQGHWSQD